MSELIERVAIAIAHAMEADMPKFTQLPWDRMSVPAKAAHCRRARAAIEAMRDPTEEMDMAGVNADSFRSLGLLKARRIWGDMIDAALKD